LLYHKYWE